MRKFSFQGAALFALVLALFAHQANAAVEVYFLRHGETPWNRAKILQGSISHVDLTDTGVQMAEETAKGLSAAGISFGRIYTSPYRRAQHTAEVVAAGGVGPAPIVDNRLREMCFGRYEGMKYGKGAYPDDNLRRFFEEPDKYIPQGDGAETFDMVGKRLRDFLENEICPLDGKVERVLCVTHSLVLKSLIREIVGDSAPEAAKKAIQRNCCVHVLLYENGQWTLKDTGRIFYSPEHFEKTANSSSVELPPAGVKSIKYVAHRGDYPDVPEGSMAAYRNAVERGSEIVKLDVHPSKDGVIVLSHDPSFKRTMDWDVEIADMTWNEIQRHTYHFEGRPTDEKAVSLPDVLKVVQTIPEFWIDFKHFDTNFCERVLWEFAKAGIDERRIMVATYTQEALRYMKAMHPAIRRIGHMDFALQNGKWSPSFLRSEGVLYAPAAEDEPFAPEVAKGILSYADEMGLWGVNTCSDPRVITKGLVLHLKKRGLMVSIALIHDAKTAKDFVGYGNDCVVTRDRRTVKPIMDCGTMPTEEDTAYPYAIEEDKDVK